VIDFFSLLQISPNFLTKILLFSTLYVCGQISTISGAPSVTKSRYSLFVCY